VNELFETARSAESFPLTFSLAAAFAAEAEQYSTYTVKCLEGLRTPTRVPLGVRIEDGPSFGHMEQR
jgi:hypothetical protein